MQNILPSTACNSAEEWSSHTLSTVHLLLPPPPDPSVKDINENRVLLLHNSNTVIMNGTSILNELHVGQGKDPKRQP